MLVGLVLAGSLLAAQAQFLQYGQVPMGRPPGAPPSRPRHPKADNKTILQFINDDPQFSRLSKALNFSKEIASGLNDTSSSVTFFAVPDYALPGKRKKSTALMTPKDDIDQLNSYDPPEIISLIEDFSVTAFDDKDKKKKHKKFLKHILNAILSYHIIPIDLSVSNLALNSTLATNLSIPGIGGGNPQRLGVQHRLLPPIITVNHYARVVVPNINTTNGYIHVINHPLLPPPPVFKELFIAMDWFSVLTSSLQHTGLDDSSDLKWAPGKDGERGKLKGSKAVTVFAPSNRAFSRLPPRLRFFLFSPLGHRILTKVLQAHVVPNLTFFTDYVYNATSTATLDASWVTTEMYDQVMLEQLDEGHPPPGAPPHRPKLIYAANATLPTLLTNFTLEARIAKFNVTLPIPTPPGHRVPYTVVTKVWVGGVAVSQPDIIGLNGAVHTLNTLINPWRKDESTPESGGEPIGGWEDWESWVKEV